MPASAARSASLIGFGCALALRQFTSFPAVGADVGGAARAWLLSSIIGLFFGIYPAREGSRLDPVVALRTEEA